jgi:hypothetical protein
MMKTLRYFMMSALMLVAGAMNAQTTFDFDEANTLFNHEGSSSGTGDSYVAAGEFAEEATATKGDFSVIVSASEAGAKTRNRIWATSPKLRMYDGTMTIKSTGAAIKSIVFTCGTTASNSKWNDSNTASVGELAVAKPTITWTGEAQEVVITIAGNTQFTKLVINGEGGDITPTPTSAEEITIAKALEIAGGLADKASTDEEYIVKGFIASDIEWVPYYKVKNDPTSEILNYNIEFILGETADAATGLTIYQPWSTNNERFAQPESAIVKGNQVILQGKIAKYGEKLELTKCHFLTYDATGIAAVKNVKAQNGVMYNLAGQVVNKGYKGLVIMNGRKFMNK